MGLAGTRISLPILAASVLFVLLFAQTYGAYGQLGEFAGHINTSVPQGGSNTVYMTIFNDGNTSINFLVQPPGIYGGAPNLTKPTVTVNPGNGTLLPRQNKQIYFTISAASDNKVNTTWQVIMIAQQVPNATNTGGAIISTGVGKIIDVTIAPPIIPWALIYAIIEVAVVVVVVVVAYYLLIIKGLLARMQESARVRSKEKMAQRLKQLKAKIAIERAKARSAGTAARSAPRKATKGAAKPKKPTKKAAKKKSSAKPKRRTRR
ncbi:MAG: hypothetical protein KGH61_03460 [Candidatus Micrarchaeota archaeon]|nr:hypothetical protein [Candidatus Micrarchaeota archaeon]MDE1847980.1 hypothetical protein [Candidatus Micrarchaeota archaeon]MDE1864677.1 hypothetical protein [Candidatus Micrarchaeota archaeon]